MHRLALAVLCVVVALSSAGAALRVPPPPPHRVNDYAGVLSPAERARLEQTLAAAEARTGNQVVVAVFPSLEDENLEDYSVRLAEAWRIGQKALDNGAIFLIFVRDRRMRIEVGYGLEGALTDATSASILHDVVAPRFRADGMAAGISAGVDAILAAIAGTYRAPARARSPAAGVDPLTLFLVAFVGMVILGMVVSAVKESARGRQQGWTGGPRGWGRRSRDGGFGAWPGPGFPSGRSGGSGGGGFSGGGGSFGGGGASGRW
ncbi:MAG TPA: TPM domain-containing protein [Candidatus Binatia bacterium]|nr:TPM domain-containing protein [Candidatus Binatia bacterium]